MAKLHPKADDRLVSLYPPCFYCTNVTMIGQQGGTLEGWACPAFPDGIPYGILTREDSHTESWGEFQDGDLVYESQVFDYPDGRNLITFTGQWHRRNAK